jgi:hypothetical protein
VPTHNPSLRPDGQKTTLTDFPPTGSDVIPGAVLSGLRFFVDQSVGEIPINPDYVYFLYTSD